MTKKVIIIGNFHSNPSASAFLEKFLTLVLSQYVKVILISGDLPAEFNGKVHWYNPHLSPSTRIFSRFINYNICQLQVALFIVKSIKRNSNIVAFFLGSHPIILLILKFLNIRTIRWQGGSYSKQTFNDKWDLKSIPMIMIFESIPNMLFDRLLVESESCILFQNLNKYRYKTYVCPLFVNQTLFYTKTKFSDRKTCIGYIGHLDKNKGILELLASFSILKQYIQSNDVTIIICGQGPLLYTLKQMTIKNDLTNNFVFLGWKRHSDVCNVLNQLKLLILPSHSEGLPNILIESMFCSTPVLATQVGAIPDLIKEGETGFLLEDASPEHMANRIIELINNPDILEKASKNSYRYARENFTFEKTVSLFKRILY